MHLSSQRNKTPHPALLLAVLFCLFMPLTSAAQYASVGEPPQEAISEESEVTVDLLPDELIPQPEIDPAELERALAEKARLENLLTALESSRPINVDRMALAQTYVELAQTLDFLNQPEEALEAYDLALQAVRISTGLDSPEQLPILQEMLWTQEKQGDWQALETTSHLSFHISRRSFDAGDQRRIDAMLQLGKWQLKSARESSEFNNSALEMTSLFRSEIEMLDQSADTPEKNIQLAQLYLGEAAARLETAKIIYDRPLSYYGTSAPRTIRTLVCREMRMPDGRIVRVCDTVERPNVDALTQPSNLKFGEMQRNLRAARDSIMSAYELLQEDGNLELRDQLLAEMQNLTGAYNTFISENSQ
ncbi:MAG: tetratricopeptide repeat protein [Gammaproteobacteria bacterium]|nr:tetratricopeptide repeat protein [Gammaproteobacteria bacterium]